MTDSESAVVLIVDDEPDVTDAYGAHASERYDVRTAYSGEEALSELDDSVDVVLLDRRMPGMIGDEVLETIRERGLDCRVAMVTAVDADFDIIDMEFDDYLTKPVTREDLLATIDRLLRCAEYERNLRQYYRVTRKFVALKSTKDASALANNEEFERLREERDKLHEELSSAAKGLADEDFETLFRDLET